MKYTKYILLTIILTGCAKTSDQSEIGTYDSKEKVIESLLTKFKEISVDTFEVHSSDDLESVNFPFHGVRLDSIEITTLPEEMRNSYDQDFYGCYKFSIDSNHVGLIIRTPSEYVISSIKLFVLDNSSKRILESYVELAESTGDAGYTLTKTSVLFKDNLSWNYLIWQHDSEDMSVQNENDTTIRTVDYLHLLTFDNEKFDTLNSDTGQLLRTYKQMSNE
jgi:hypothetical protein